jgi:hypothetical protein
LEHCGFNTTLLKKRMSKNIVSHGTLSLGTLSVVSHGTLSMSINIVALLQHCLNIMSTMMGYYNNVYQKNVGYNVNEKHCH